MEHRPATPRRVPPAPPLGRARDRKQPPQIPSTTSTRGSSTGDRGVGSGRKQPPQPWTPQPRSPPQKTQREKGEEEGEGAPPPTADAADPAPEMPNPPAPVPEPSPTAGATPASPRRPAPTPEMSRGGKKCPVVAVLAGRRTSGGLLGRRRGAGRPGTGPKAAARGSPPVALPERRGGDSFFLLTYTRNKIHFCNTRSRLRARLVQLHEQLHNFNSRTANSQPNSLVSFSENSLS
jgi:hypothetical protein